MRDHLWGNVRYHADSCDIVSPWIASVIEKPEKPPNVSERLCDSTRVWNTFLSSLWAGKWMCRVLLMLLCCHITPETPVKFFFSFFPWSAVRKVPRRWLIALLQRWCGWQRRNSCIINGIAAKRHADELWVALAPREFVLLIDSGFTQPDSIPPCSHEDGAAPDNYLFECDTNSWGSHLISYIHLLRKLDNRK